jgi:hypothetical protein
MNYRKLASIVATTLIPSSTPMARAVDDVLFEAERAKTRCPWWWHWTISLDAAITIAQMTGIHRAMQEHEASKGAQHAV